MKAPLVQTKSRANNKGGSWFVADVWQDASDSPSGLTLEFYITDGDGNDDRPSDKGVYICNVPGGYKLLDGKLAPFTRATKGPVMVVSPRVCCVSDWHVEVSSNLCIVLNYVLLWSR